ncbi:hypothetical protein GH714_032900 [Hevea brasiliensis]|uniref:Cytochrome P450 n=1 Tax=Hevea brasiliensis TaxID=3981 RepID=A0A6A6LPZ2_HEVBR|nr:hypothetical protein GH714_032900 [Hevea brasiliensis]
MLHQNDIVFANRPLLTVAKYVDYNHTTLASAPYGDHWRNLRRLSTLEILSSNRLNKFLGIRRDEIKNFLNKLYQVSSKDFGKVELRPMFSELTFNTIMHMITGKPYCETNEARHFREIIREVFKFAETSYPGDFLPILQWIDYQGSLKKLKVLSKRTDVLLQGLIDGQRNDKAGNTMISHLLSLQESQPEYYTDEIIKGLIMNIILETLRLCPAAPLLLPHLSNNECSIGGYVVPKNTMLLVNAWAIHRDSQMWDDALKFKPERFEMVKLRAIAAVLAIRTWQEGLSRDGSCQQGFRVCFGLYDSVF